MIYLATDHGSYQLKEEIKTYLAQNNISAEDLGAHTLDPEDDYPDFIIPVAKRVASDPSSLGIIIGRSGNGEAIAANKVRGIRAALCLNEEMARKARQHNDANILSLGADYITQDEAKRIVRTFIETNFSNEDRHIRRIEKIKKIEKAA